MKNLRKLSRNQLTNLKGGGDDTSKLCHMNYTGTLWGEDMVITSVGSGACPKPRGCYQYTQTSSTCSA